MIHSTKYIGILFFFHILLLATCKKKEIYPAIPSVEYKSVVFYKSATGGDSLMLLTFTFKDGDGDIGLGQQDTLYPYQANRDKYNKPTNPYYNNLHINYYEWMDTAYQQIIKELDPDATPPVYDTLKYLYRVENITPEGRHKAIRGDIEVKIYPSPHFDARDTVKYQFYIYDRALNKSNLAETPPIVWERE